MCTKPSLLFSLSLAILIASLAALVAVAEEQKSTEQTTQSKSATTEAVVNDFEREFYFCPDEKNPCLADTADGCSKCPVDLMRSAYTIGAHMEVLKLLMKPIKTDISGKNYDLLTQRNNLIQAVANRIPEFKPKKNVEKIEDYIKTAGELAQFSQEFGKAIEAKDEAALDAQFKNMGDSCSKCHKVFRKIF